MSRDDAEPLQRKLAVVESSFVRDLNFAVSAPQFRTEIFELRTSVAKANRVIYWISTIWLALGMLATGTLQLSHAKAEGALAPPGVYGMIHLGYPTYLLTILGVWKILGVIAILVPRYALLKEWAYAGFFFAMTGALFSHIAVHDSIIELIPSTTLLCLTGLSWYFRPASRKISARP